MTDKMELTGKAEIAFEKWYLWIYLNLENVSPFYTSMCISDFNDKRESEKFGVYVDWFGSVGMAIEIQIITRKTFGWMINYDMEVYYNNEYETRLQARTAAIKKANEINNQNQ